MDTSRKSGPTTATPVRPVRRLVLFLLTISPFVLLIMLLAWGQLKSDGNPGGLLVHSESGDVDVAVHMAPEFADVDLVSGLQMNNEVVAGKIVMVDFWSSWCVACMAEAANLAEVYREYDGQQVEFVGIAIWDETGDSLRYLNRYGIDYPNIIDARGSTAVTYGVRGVPEKFFIDAEGRIVKKINGPVSKERLREVIDGLLDS
jgi:cytochrome c biogenesis protein CcmG/thiol:disulfide interchange protein DsbE